MTSDYGVQISQIHSCREWVKARNEAARWQEAWTRSYRYNMIVPFWKVVRIFDTFSFSSNEM